MISRAPSPRSGVAVSHEGRDPICHEQKSSVAKAVFTSPPLAATVSSRGVTIQEHVAANCTMAARRSPTTTSHVLGDVDLFASAVNGSSAGPCAIDGRVNLIHGGWVSSDHPHSRSVSMRIVPVPPDASSDVPLTVNSTPQRPESGLGVTTVSEEVPHPPANALNRHITEQRSRTRATELTTSRGIRSRGRASRIVLAASAASYGLSVIDTANANGTIRTFGLKRPRCRRRIEPCRRDTRDARRSIPLQRHGAGLRDGRQRTFAIPAPLLRTKRIRHLWRSDHIEPSPAPHPGQRGPIDRRTIDFLLATLQLLHDLVIPASVTHRLVLPPTTRSVAAVVEADNRVIVLTL